MSSPWVRAQSRSTGKWYFSNAGTRQSLWEDTALPPGWAWGRDAEAAPMYYVHMPTGLKQFERPTEAPGPLPVADGSALALNASNIAGDDLLSTAYVPDIRSRGANVPPAIASKRDYLFSSVAPEQRWQLQVDEVSLYSITEAHLAETQAALIEQLCGGRDLTITDATACVGGNTIAFARRFSHVHAVELSAQRAGMLQHNVRVCGLAAKVTVHACDYLAIMSRLRQDVVFFDPPWGGPGYKAAQTLNMYLGSADIADIIATLTRPVVVTDSVGGSPAGRAPCRFVVLKAPVNFNVAGLKARLAADGCGAAVVRTEEQRKMLLLLVAAGTKPAAVSAPPPVVAAAPAPAVGVGVAPLAASSCGFKRSHAAAGMDLHQGGAPPPAPAPDCKEEEEEVAFEVLLPVPVYHKILRPDGGPAAPDAGAFALLPCGVYLAPPLAADGNKLPTFTLASAPAFFRCTADRDNPGALVLAPTAADAAAAAAPSGPPPFALRPVLASIATARGVQGVLLTDGSWSLVGYSLPSSVAAALSRCGARDPVTAAIATDLVGVATTAMHLEAASAPASGSAVTVLQRALQMTLALQAPQRAVDAAVGSCCVCPLWVAPVLAAHCSRLLQSDAAVTVAVAGGGGVRALLGFPAFADRGEVGRGKRGSVRGVRIAGRGGGAVSGVPEAEKELLALKVQPRDARVRQELCAGLALAAAAGHNDLSSSSVAVALPVVYGLAARGAECFVAYPYAGPASLEQTILGTPAAADPVARALPPLLSLAQGVALLRRVLVGLDLLHATGLAYLDLHPGNVVLAAGGDPASATIVDLGSAQPLSVGEGGAGGCAAAYAGATRGGRWDMMPPEQFGPDPPYATGAVTLSAAADVFAAATTLLFALTGEAVFAPRAVRPAKLTVAGTRGHPLRAAPPPPLLQEYVEAAVAAANGRGGGGRGGAPPLDAPAAALVAAVLLRALQPDPAARFPAAGDMLRALPPPL